MLIIISSVINLDITGLCASAFKQTVDYYTCRGSHVFTCFVDFSKAFDRVNYWKLLIKLLNDNVDYSISECWHMPTANTLILSSQQPRSPHGAPAGNWLAITLWRFLGEKTIETVLCVLRVMLISKAWAYSTDIRVCRAVHDEAIKTKSPAYAYAFQLYSQLLHP